MCAKESQKMGKDIYNMQTDKRLTFRIHKEQLQIDKEKSQPNTKRARTVFFC